MASKTIREMIVDALVEGFDGRAVAEEEGDEITNVWVEGHDEPIKVHPLDVDIPLSLEECRMGIQLDVRAILATLDE